MAILKREDILRARLRHETVTVPELGGDVVVWEMDGKKKAQVQSEVSADGPVADLHIALARATVGDESGPYNLTAAEAMKISSVALERIAEVAATLSVVSRKAAEELLGNSQGGPGGDATSGSP